MADLIINYAGDYHRKLKPSTLVSALSKLKRKVLDDHFGDINNAPAVK